ncbi:MAG: hypothetical protein OXC25_10205 [Thiotrichales bacterium]|nr:hypothetical protein [Thiotrichales bacterium]
MSRVSHGGISRDGPRPRAVATTATTSAGIHTENEFCGLGALL